MIKPHKYFDLKVSVINQSALILHELKLNTLLKYDELSRLIVANLGENAKEIFPYSLNFLFLLDKIKYHSEIDVIELK